MGTSLWDSVTNWVATDVLSYADEAIEFADDVTAPSDLMSAGDYFRSDISDTLGFIKQGAKVYTEVAGLGRGADGKLRGGNSFQGTKFQRPRSVNQLTRGGGSRGDFRASPVKSVGGSNVDIRTAVANLMNSSYNQQMNKMMAQYTVNPTVRQGKQYTTGTMNITKAKKSPS